MEVRARKDLRGHLVRWSKKLFVSSSILKKLQSYLPSCNTGLTPLGHHGKGKERQSPAGLALPVPSWQPLWLLQGPGVLRRQPEKPPPYFTEQEAEAQGRDGIGSVLFN